MRRCHRLSTGIVAAPARAPVTKNVAWLDGGGTLPARILGGTDDSTSSSSLRGMIQHRSTRSLPIPSVRCCVVDIWW